jgi:hypothetical protein
MKGRSVVVCLMCLLLLALTALVASAAAVLSSEEMNGLLGGCGNGQCEVRGADCWKGCTANSTCEGGSTYFCMVVDTSHQKCQGGWSGDNCAYKPADPDGCGQQRRNGYCTGIFGGRYCAGGETVGNCKRDIVDGNACN